MAQQMMLMRAAPHAQMGQQGVPQQMIGMQPVMVALQGVPMGYGPQVTAPPRTRGSRSSTASSPAAAARAAARRTAAAAAGGVPYSAQPAASAAAARREPPAPPPGPTRCRRVALDAAVAAGVVAAVASDAPGDAS